MTAVSPAATPGCIVVCAAPCVFDSGCSLQRIYADMDIYRDEGVGVEMGAETNADASASEDAGGVMSINQSINQSIN